MQPYPELVTGSHAQLLSGQQPVEAAAELENFGGPNGRKKRSRGNRSPLSAAATAVWAVLVAALAVATLLTNCFHLSDGWKKHQPGKRRLSDGQQGPYGDPETQAIIDMCLAMVDPSQSNVTPAPPASVSLTALEDELADDSAYPYFSGHPQQAGYGFPPPQPAPTWGFPPQPAYLPAPYTAGTFTPIPAPPQPAYLPAPYTAGTFTPMLATAAAQTLMTHSAPTYRSAFDRSSYSMTRVSWSYGSRPRHLPPAAPPQPPPPPPGYIVLGRPQPLPTLGSGFVSSRDLGGSATGQYRQLEPSVPPAAAPGYAQPLPQAFVADPGQTPHTSKRIAPCSQAERQDDYGAGDLDPEEGPSTGPKRHRRGKRHLDKGDSTRKRKREQGAVSDTAQEAVSSTAQEAVSSTAQEGVSDTAQGGVSDTAEEAVSYTAQEGVSGTAQEAISDTAWVEEPESPSPAPKRRSRRRSLSPLQQYVFLGLSHASEVPKPEHHPFYRLPKVAPFSMGDVFCTHLAFSPSKLLSVPYYGLAALRSLLSKEAMCAREVSTAIRAAERLASCMYHFQREPIVYLRPYDAVRILGVRYLAFDALLSLVQVLGPAMRAGEWWSELVRMVPSDIHFGGGRGGVPRRNWNAALAMRLSEAIEMLKKGIRPSASDTVELKRWLFCSVSSPAYFKEPKWDPWRDDDKYPTRN